MPEAHFKGRLRGLAQSAIAAFAAIGLLTPAAARETRLFVNPDSTTMDAAARLEGEARRDALLLARFPSAT